MRDRTTGRAIHQRSAAFYRQMNSYSVPRCRFLRPIGTCDRNFPRTCPAGVAAAFPDFFVTGSLSDMLTLPHWPLKRDGTHGRGRTGGASVRGSGSSSTGNEEQWLQLSLQSVEVSLYLVSKTEWKTLQESSGGFEKESEKPSWFWLEFTSGTGQETMTPSVKPGVIVVLRSLSIWSQRQSEYTMT